MTETPRYRLLEDRDDGLVWLNNRLVGIVELNRSELALAVDCAHRRNRPGLQANPDNLGQPQRAGDLAMDNFVAHEIGAQGELAVARWLGIEAPLAVDTFHNRPDLPENWSVTTHLSTAKDMRDGYLRLRQRHLHSGWRHVLVERDEHIDGSLVFILHGWIADDQARELGRHRYAYSTNLHVHIRNLQPMPPRLCQLDEQRIADRAERWILADHLFEAT